MLAGTEPHSTPHTYTTGYTDVFESPEYRRRNLLLYFIYEVCVFIFLFRQLHLYHISVHLQAGLDDIVTATVQCTKFPVMLNIVLFFEYLAMDQTRVMHIFCRFHNRKNFIVLLTALVQYST